MKHAHKVEMFFGFSASLIFSLKKYVFFLYFSFLGGELYGVYGGVPPKREGQGLIGQCEKNPSKRKKT